MGAVRDYLLRHFRHFNAAELVEAGEAWRRHASEGGKMLVALGGAMSTAEIGRSLSELIRRELVHGISTTGANLEEDAFLLCAGKQYARQPRYRDLTPRDEARLASQKLYRVTDTCIPEEPMVRVEMAFLGNLRERSNRGERAFPHEVFYDLVRSEELKPYDSNPEDSWLVAASEANLPIWTPGWEDSSTANSIAAYMAAGDLPDWNIVRGGLEAMGNLAAWYQRERAEGPVGFFQVGGGIAGDFPICVVPMILQELQEDTEPWSYFCQISDAHESYGSYSGASPNEKITWHKLTPETPRFSVESDATIVFPLVAALALDR